MFCRFSTWNWVRCRWIGCASIVVLTICHTSTVFSFGVAIPAVREVPSAFLNVRLLSSTSAGVAVTGSITSLRNMFLTAPGVGVSGWIAWAPDRNVAVARFAAGVPAGGEKPAAVPTVNCMICLSGTPPRCTEFGPLGYGALALLYHWNFDPAG